VLFTNVFGTLPLRIDGAALSLRDRDVAIVPGASRRLTFSGQPAAAIPAGAVLASDPVDLAVPPNADLAIDLFSPVDTTAWASALTVHTGATQTNYLSPRGNYVGQPSFVVAGITASWFFLSRVEVETPAATPALIAIGDSITDGAASTRDANNRYPDQLTRRLQAASRSIGVLNEGIGGNRLLSETTGSFGINLLARWDRDVLAVPGVRYVVVLEGINDIGGRPSPSADDLIAAHRQVVERAHAAGLLIYGATLRDRLRRRHARPRASVALSGDIQLRRQPAPERRRLQGDGRRRRSVPVHEVTPRSRGVSAVQRLRSFTVAGYSTRSPSVVKRTPDMGVGMQESPRRSIRKSSSGSDMGLLRLHQGGARRAELDCGALNAFGHLLLGQTEV
jgi:hypothetical protein